MKVLPLKWLAPLSFCALIVSISAQSAPDARAYGNDREPATAKAAILRLDDRIVFIGDSITGQGASPQGWTGLIGEALKAVYPKSNFTLVSLGGSGHGVGSWKSIEKNSRIKGGFLDVKNVDIKEELDQPADVIISMLGMNDVLFPRLRQTEEDYDNWITSYIELATTLAERTRPRVFALATPTLCTEDVSSPKNLVMQALNARLHALGKSKSFVILPTYEAMEEILETGRSYDPNFHVTRDSVHPNAAGHLAIAVGMLRGLGEERAARYIYEKYIPKLCKVEAASLSWRVEALPADIGSETQKYRIRYFLRPPISADERVTLEVPAGWRVLSSTVENSGGEYLVEGTPDRLVNALAIRAGSRSCTISIPAPWLIGTGAEGGGNWVKNTIYDPLRKAHPVDAPLSQGRQFGTVAELIPGKPLVWKRHTASIDLGGGNQPGAIDMAGLTFYQNFDVAYGARWIYSETARPLKIQVRPAGFVAGSHLALWLNGVNVFEGHTKDAPAEGALVELQEGWNALVFKSNHRAVQWQFAINLLGENLDQLKFSTVPKPSRGNLQN